MDMNKYEQLQKENDELKAYIELLREVIFHAACDLAESDIEDDDGLKELHDSLVSASKIIPSQSLNHIKAQVEEETIDKYAKDIATEFFYHWYNAQGSNTVQGFDEWWELNRERFVQRKYKEQSNAENM